MPIYQDYSVCRLRMVDENGPTVAIELIGNNVQDTWNKASNGMFQEGIHYDVSTGDTKGYFTDRRRYPTTATTKIATNEAIVCYKPKCYSVMAKQVKLLMKF